MAATNSTERAWLPPESAQPTAVLRLYNSLLDDKVPFVPRGGPDSKQLVWYCCGPTVYDVAHIGHARNYVTFDIVRRVLEDYFGYNVTYIMNVTDVDDKIILRARRNHLVQKYLDEGHAATEMLSLCSEAAKASAGSLVRSCAGTLASTLSSSEARLNSPCTPSSDSLSARAFCSTVAAAADPNDRRHIICAQLSREHEALHVRLTA